MGVLRVNVGGSWVDVATGLSNTDEVWVGPDPPTGSGVEIWYDTDAVSPPVPTVLPKIGGGLIADTALAVANTWTDWGGGGAAQFVLANPGVSVNIVASVCGQGQDFNAVTQFWTRVGISIDGGSTYTTGQEPSFTVGQGGVNVNRATAAAGNARANVVPTGAIYVKAQAKNTGTASTMVAGFMNWWVTVA